MSEVKEQFRDILRQGVEMNIFAAEEAIFLYEVISNHADGLTQNRYMDSSQ
jgi:hypothetical protein